MERNNIGNNGCCSVKCVLITRFSALGDVAMTIPVVYSVCTAHPEVHFVMVTQQVASTLFINAPKNLTAIGADVKDTYAGLLGKWQLATDLQKKYHFDAFIDLQNDKRTRIMGLRLWLAGVKVLRIDNGTAGKRALTRRHGKRMLPLISSRARYREVFHRLGLDFEKTFTSIFGTQQATPDVFAEISQPKPDGSRWIAIAPFAKFKGKIYPMELMEKTIDIVASWDNTHIFLFGAGEAEHKQLKQWANKHHNVTSVADKRHGFACELALLSYCDVMLSMDSANMHLASLVRLPVVSIWGATHPYCGYMGWKQSEADAIQLNMACRPCSVVGDKDCYFNDFFCLTGIQPTLVASRIAEKFSH